MQTWIALLQAEFACIDRIDVAVNLTR